MKTTLTFLLFLSSAVVNAQFKTFTNAARLTEITLESSYESFKVQSNKLRELLFNGGYSVEANNIIKAADKLAGPTVEEAPVVKKPKRSLSTFKGSFSTASDKGIHSEYECNGKKVVNETSEHVQSLEIDSPMILSAKIKNRKRAKILGGIFLLDSEGKCLEAGKDQLQAPLRAGTYSLVIEGPKELTEKERKFSVTIGMRPTHEVDCLKAMRRYSLKTRWKSCHKNISKTGKAKSKKSCVCTKGYCYAKLPAHGPIVQEAHLVTKGGIFPKATCRSSYYRTSEGKVRKTKNKTWPRTMKEKIKKHHMLSETTTAYAMHRTQPWAPPEGSRVGQGSRCRPLPLESESWYINMEWKKKPGPGEKFFAYNTETNRAAIMAGGYETGPHKNNALAGMPEEAHSFLKTGGHRRKGKKRRWPVKVSKLKKDLQHLPYGPVLCKE